MAAFMDWEFIVDLLLMGAFALVFIWLAVRFACAAYYRSKAQFGKDRSNED